MSLAILGTGMKLTFSNFVSYFCIIAGVSSGIGIVLFLSSFMVCPYGFGYEHIKLINPSFTS